MVALTVWYPTPRSLNTWRDRKELMATFKSMLTVRFYWKQIAFKNMNKMNEAGKAGRNGSSFHLDDRL